MNLTTQQNQEIFTRIVMTSQSCATPNKNSVSKVFMPAALLQARLNFPYNNDRTELCMFVFTISELVVELVMDRNV